MMKVFDRLFQKAFSLIAFFCACGVKEKVAKEFVNSNKLYAFVYTLL